jgi:nitric-oxide synthase, bacterial
VACPAHCPPRTESFWLTPCSEPAGEAEAFLHQMRCEGALSDVTMRLEGVRSEIARTGTWSPTTEEAIFGARIAWRNSIRCVGRMFWPSLQVFDARDLSTPGEIFEAVRSHIRWSTNGGDLRPALTLFRPGEPRIRILNAQLILYAGYVRADGTVLGDPKNVPLTRLATRLGWRGAGTGFDPLPLIIRIGDAAPTLHELPRSEILEVPIRHPDTDRLDRLGLRWFALPAVSGMALDMGGVQFTAAPSSGVYQGTEIGSVNLGDPRRYDRLPAVADALGLDMSRRNPLWRDQAMVELNRAVLHAFAEAGVRIMDHHALSESFDKFRKRERAAGREAYGHWPWLVPPLSSNLAAHWHDPSLKKVILKPGYFYQPVPELNEEARALCPHDAEVDPSS